MSDDDFEDILEHVGLYHTLPADRFEMAEYEKLMARVANTGGEEQRARLADLLDDIQREAEDARGDDGADDEPRRDLTDTRGGIWR